MDRRLVPEKAGPSTYRDQESRRLLARASKSIAKGASSSMRVLDYALPLVVDRAEGARIWDADGNELIDMNMGYGPLIFGHRPPVIVAAIEAELRQRGTLLGFADALSFEVAELIKDSVPSIDLLRFTSTGTETAQTAVRLARAFTGRSKIVLFEGHYHGSSDATYHRYHASPKDLGRTRDDGVVPGTAGMGGAPHDAIVVPFNDTDALARVMERHNGDVAAIMLEPVMGNAGVIPPDPGYLEFLREAANTGGAVLILDEVITGFRIARGGAQERFGVAADITMLSKAMSGGVPLGAVGGRAEIMQLMVDGTVFHGGVYSGNPMSLAAALAAQRAYEEDGEAIYRQLEASSARLADGLRRMLAEADIPCLVQRVGGMLSCWILRDVGDAPRNYREIAGIADHDRFVRFQHAAQRHGVYFHPNQYEPWYVATVHTPQIIDSVLERLRAAIRSVDWNGSD